jgi:hypothetical protein
MHAQVVRGSVNIALQVPGMNTARSFIVEVRDAPWYEAQKHMERFRVASRRDKEAFPGILRMSSSSKEKCVSTIWGEAVLPEHT